MRKGCSSIWRDLRGMDDHVSSSAYQRYRGALRRGVRGTPAFFVNGRIHDVSYGIRTLFDAVETALHHRGR